MLLRFELQNWTSFRESSELSLIAGREKQHGERLPRVAKYRMRVLPVAAIYGGNASGKSNLFKGLMFARRFIIRGTQPDAPISVRPFLFDDKSHREATRFVFEILVRETVYEFAFAVTERAVVSESLTEIRSTSETILYRRSGDVIRFDPAFEASMKEGRQFLEFVSRGTRSNELFLTNAVSQRVERLKDVWGWFRDSLTLIAPESTFEPSELLADSTNPLSTRISDALIALDTGIVGLAEQETRLADLGLPAGIEEEIRRVISTDTGVRYRDPLRNERYVFYKNKKGSIRAKKLVARHLRSDGQEVTLDLRNEADGTQRVIDLLPAFCEISDPNSDQVFVIDELDRSLHSLLTRQLVGSFLDTCSAQSRAQLVFTTHDLMLMDQDILRRDEMWVAERDSAGGSSIFSFSEYKDVRYDKDLRKSYLQGRLGGIPRLLFREACAAKAEAVSS